MSEACKTVLFDGRLDVHYGQFYVIAGDRFAAITQETRAGQMNGLCGAAVPGVLFLTTGLHTGAVGLRVERHNGEPDAGDSWEEIVEASFVSDGADVQLVQWAGEASWPLALPAASYRVRYCAAGMDEGRANDVVTADEPVVDRYLLQFWPAEPAADRVVKRTSAIAAYWHDVAQQQPPPPSPEERAEAERLAVLDKERANAALRLEEEKRNWGGTLPSTRLRSLSWDAIQLARLDRALVDAIDQTDAHTQRAIARWSVRRAFIEAQLAEVDWIAPALVAMDRGEALPALFDDQGHAFNRLFADERVAKTVTTMLDSSDDFLQQAMAFPALYVANGEDPLRAAVKAVWVAANTFGYGRDKTFFAELRRAFPSLGMAPGNPRTGPHQATLRQPRDPQIPGF